MSMWDVVVRSSECDRYGIWDGDARCKMRAKMDPENIDRPVLSVLSHHATGRHAHACRSALPKLPRFCTCPSRSSCCAMPHVTHGDTEILLRLPSTNSIPYVVVRAHSRRRAGDTARIPISR